MKKTCPKCGGTGSIVVDTKICEKCDGTGNQNHKRDPDILKEVQNVTVCDIYDALTEKRAYREGKNMYKAFKILSEEKIDELAFLLLASCPDK